MIGMADGRNDRIGDIREQRSELTDLEDHHERDKQDEQGHDLKRAVE